MELKKLASKISSKAKKNGALQTLETKCEIFNDPNCDIPFIIRKMSDNSNKFFSKSVTNCCNKDPFLFPEQELIVKELGPTHLLILNKYNVVKNHLLIITKEFIDQELPITKNDFLALKMVMKEIDGLAFYNSGKIAGASQSHRHLQLAPTPLAEKGQPIPINDILIRECPQNLGQLKTLPYRNLACLVPDLKTNNWEEKILKIYSESLKLLNLVSEKRLLPYNLLITKDWFLMVPRVNECYQSISINGLGIAGTFLVKNQDEYDLLITTGPSKILAHISSGPM